MKTAIIAATYLVATFITGATPVSAQTLPFYNVDEQVAKCIADVPKNREEWAKKNAEWLKKNAEKDVAKVTAELMKLMCNDLREKEREIRDKLAKHWDSHDPSVRFQCIASPQVVDSTSLQKCIEYIEKKSGNSRQHYEAARRANRR